MKKKDWSSKSSKDQQRETSDKASLDGIEVLSPEKKPDRVAHLSGVSRSRLPRHQLPSGTGTSIKIGMKCLIVKKRWLDLVFEGKKTWELRGSRTAVRGKIGLIEKGSGTVMGTCEVVDVEGPLSLSVLKGSTARHGVPAGEFGETPPYKQTFAWVLDNALRYSKPRPYKHPSGAAIWVTVYPAVRNRFLTVPKNDDS